MKRFFNKLGPGLLMAAAAIGVSHLVQSTRAGADYGFGLLGFIVLANLVKYPFLEVGPRYALATGNSLLEGYSRLGKWALWVYGLLTAATMFIILAAVTLFTASLASNMFSFQIDLIWYSIIILLLCTTLLAFGQYHALNNIIRWVMLILLLSSLAALVLVLYEGPAGDLSSGVVIDYDFVTFGFILALMGWMPIPLDASVWHSFWALEYQKDTDIDQNTGINVPESDRFLLKDGLKDFNVGFMLAAVLAVLFMVLGAYVMYGTSLVFSNSGAVFADQLMQLYTQSLGQWTYPIIATAAFSTMFSTTLTVFDSSPRVWKGFVELYQQKNQTKEKTTSINSEHVYTISMLIIALGAILIQLFFLEAFKSLIDLATILSFLTAPVLAFMNYKVMMHSSIPESAKWGRKMRILAIVGIFFLTILTSIYLVWLIL